MYRIPAGSLVLPTSDADLEYLLKSHRSHVARDARQLDPRLRTRITSIVPTTNAKIHRDVAARARNFGASVVVVGHCDDPDVSPSIVIPTGSDIALLSTDDVSDAGDVVVVGDVHNCHHTLSSLLEELGVGDTQDGVAPLVVFVGDLIDKGGSGPADALATLDLVSDLVRTGRAVSLRGNHDHMLGRRLAGKSSVTDYAAPLVDAVNGTDEMESYLKFLNSLPLAVTLSDDMVAVHANYSPKLHGQAHPRSRHHMEQVCCFGAPARDSFDGTIVHGHEPEPSPAVVTDGHTIRINVDTGACEGNALTGYRVGHNPHSPEGFVSVPTDPRDLPT